jgi:hypothetical protein
MSDEKQGPNLTKMRNAAVGYETSDASVRGVVWFLFILTVAGVLIHLVLAGMYKHFAGPNVSLYEHRPTLETYSKQPQPPGPRLQHDPVADKNLLFDQQEQRLNSYGWTDEKAGTAHIPIDRAMDLVAQRGIPARPPQSASQFRETLNMGAAAPGGVVIPQSVAQKKTPPQK